MPGAARRALSKGIQVRQLQSTTAKTPVKERRQIYSFTKVNGIFVASGYRDTEQSFVHQRKNTKRFTIHTTVNMASTLRLKKKKGDSETKGAVAEVPCKFGLKCQGFYSDGHLN